MGAIHVSMLNDERQSAQIVKALTEAAGAPRRFVAELEGAHPDPQEEEAKKKAAQESLNRVFDFFGRENVRVKG